MNPILLLLTLFFQADDRAMVITDQAEHRVVLMLVPSGQILRDWRAADIPEAHRKWFRNPSEAKLSRDCNFILTCASGGGAAIIRISDGKTMWYDSVGGNPHSIDIAPGHTAVVASSTGNRFTVFRYDTTVAYKPGRPRKSSMVPDAHAVNFYDGRFYIAGGDHIMIYSFSEGKKKRLAELVQEAAVKIPGHGAHDMIYGSRQDIFYITTVDTLLEFHAPDKSFHPISGTIHRNIKSFSESADGPATVTVPKIQWWTDDVTDLNGNIILRLPGAKIYKARWLRCYTNTFVKINTKGDTTYFKKW